MSIGKGDSSSPSFGKSHFGRQFIVESSIYSVCNDYKPSTSLNAEQPPIISLRDGKLEILLKPEMLIEDKDLKLGKSSIDLQLLAPSIVKRCKAMVSWPRPLGRDSSLGKSLNPRSDRRCIALGNPFSLTPTKSHSHVTRLGMFTRFNSFNLGNETQFKR